MVQYRVIDVKGHKRKAHKRKMHGKIFPVKAANVNPSQRNLPPKLTESDFKKLVEAEELKEKEKIQIEEKDWAHLSIKYPNLIGLTDQQIEKFIDDEINDMHSSYDWTNDVLRSMYDNPFIDEFFPEPNGDKWFNKGYKEFSYYVQDKHYNGKSLMKNIRRKELEIYISKMKCYNKEDLEEISKKSYSNLHAEFDKIQNLIAKGQLPQQELPSLNYDTVYLTSPRGGLETLSTFAYANHISKEIIPFDLDIKSEYSRTLATNSLPYGRKVEQVRDIIYIDDICMSGEQQTKAYDTLQDTLEKLKVDKNKKPRLHYLALVGSSKVIKEEKGRRVVVPEEETQREWTSVTIGDLHNFEKNKKGDYDDVSAIVFPYSIPDGTHHQIARNLYKTIDKYHHL